MSILSALTSTFRRIPTGTLAPLASELTTSFAAKASLSGATFTGDINVPDEAYDATAWNGSLEAPTKNAIRDKIESLGSSDARELVPGRIYAATNFR